MDDLYDLNQATFTKTDDIMYQADDAFNSGQVDWVTVIEYATSSGKGAFRVSDSFSSKVNTATSRSYSSEGGRLTINTAERISNSATATACPIQYVYIEGSVIPNSTITARLLSLYHGATPRLLTGIATVESNYRQFAQRTLYGVNALWPHESYDGGSHIGLMQMPVTRENAWNWQSNTTNAARLFAEKIRIAKSFERNIRKSYRDLPALTDVQIENMALVLYGPYASRDINEQYYMP